MKLSGRIAMLAVGAYTISVSLFAFSWPAPVAHAATGARDCDNNSIIYCGSLTTNELLSDYDKNTTGDLDNIYSHYGIARSDLAGTTSQVKIGRVYKDGRVVVDGVTVATGAHSVGRQDMPGSHTVTIAGKTYFERSDTRNFQSDFIDAFVLMRGGTFYRAVLMSCGNPVMATPVAPKPTPVAACSALQVNKISRDTYEFSTTASISGGATISGYTFTITHSSGTAKIITVTSAARSASSGAVQLETGTHAVKVVVRTSLGDRTAAACTTSVTVPAVPVSKVEVCNPATGQTISVIESDVNMFKPVGDAACTPVQVCSPTTGQTITVVPAQKDLYKPVGDETCLPKVQGVTTVTTAPLPSTGPGDALAGGFGLTSLTAAGYYWRASRRRLLGALLNR